MTGTIIRNNSTAYLIPGMRRRAKTVSWDKVAMIERVVCDFYGRTMDELKSKSRKRQLVWPRQVCIYFLKKETTLSLAHIAKMFGERDHSTACYSIQLVKNILDTEPMVKRDVSMLEELIHKELYI